MQKAAWSPTVDQVQQMRMHQLMKKSGMSTYHEWYQRTVADPAWFWKEVVSDLELQWFHPYTKVFDESGGMAWPRWFVNGRMNVAYNCLDRWAEDETVCQQRALVAEADDGEVKTFTFQELRDQVAQAAYGLQELGLGKGDRVAIFLPMIAENVISMLAVARIGAIFTPCFSGYGGDAVAKRIQDCEASLLITADGFRRRGKIVSMKEEADRAVALSPSIKKVIVVPRVNSKAALHPDWDIPWSQLTKTKKSLPCTETNGDDPFMIIYTSGTTGRPKGTVHSHAGFPIKAAFDAGYGMDLHPGETLFWMTDMGWMMGQWMVFGSLMNRSGMVLFAGTPDYPNPDRLWALAEDHGITHMGVSPTVIRSLIKFGDEWTKKRNISSVRIFGSTGEPWNPEPWQWLFETVGKKQVPIFNYSGGTEISGGILFSNLMKPIAPCSFSGPMPGMAVDIVNPHGESVQEKEIGELVIKKPWVGMTQGFWKDPTRYEKTYWGRWKDAWVHGDWVEITEEGYWYISGRSDDTLKIAGKRLGPAEMESVLVSHPRVLEAATIGIPDEVKGEAAVCFVIVKPNEQTMGLEKILMEMVGKQLGKALRPQKIYFVNELPKTRNGKILRRALKAAYTGQDAGDLSSLENPQIIDALVQRFSH